MSRFFAVALCFIVSVSGSFLYSQNSSEITEIFDYCGDKMYDRGFGSSKDMNVGVAIYLPQIEKIPGNKVTSINIGLKKEISEIELFISESLDSSPAFIQSVMDLKEGWNEINLNTDFFTSGKPLYVGYKCHLSAGALELGVSTNEPCDNAFFLSTDGGQKYSDVSSKYSPISIRVTVKGSNFPFDVAEVEYVNHSYSKVGGSHPIVFGVKNTGYNKVSSLDGEILVSGIENSFPFAVESISIPVKGVSVINTEISSLPEGVYDFELRLNKVNGKNLDEPRTVKFDRYIHVVPESLRKQPVCEKITGNYCPYCPRGIVAFDYMYEKYKDSFIGISADVYEPMDPLYIEEYTPIINIQSSAPYFIVDRKRGSGEQDLLENDFNEALKDFTWGELNVTVDNISHKDKSLDVNVKTKFSVTQDDSHYRIILVAMENGVMSFQRNGYAGGGYGKMGGWENLGNVVDTVFDHVARRIVDYYGIEGSVPEKIEKDRVYEFNYTMDLKSVSDLNKSEIVAMLLNCEDGQVINASKVKIQDGSSINKVDKHNVACNVVDGNITISFDSATDRKITLYNLDGAVVKELVTCSNNEVIPFSGSCGIYVLTVNEGIGLVYRTKIAVY